MTKPTKAQLNFLIAVSQQVVTAVAHTRINTAYAKSIFIVKSISIDGMNQHHSKIKTVTTCLENKWIRLTREWGFCTVTLTKTGNKLIEDTK